MEETAIWEQHTVTLHRVSSYNWLCVPDSGYWWLLKTIRENQMSGSKRKGNCHIPLFKFRSVVKAPFDSSSICWLSEISLPANNHARNIRLLLYVTERCLKVFLNNYAVTILKCFKFLFAGV